MSGLFGWFFNRARPESQGPTPEELAEAEENGEEWDDRIGFYPANQKPSDTNDNDSEEDQDDGTRAEEYKK